MPRHASDPLAGATRLLVDGTNLLHALDRAGGALPAAAVIGRLRALVPPGVGVTIVLDGTPAPGAIGRRLTSGVEVRYAGARSADVLLHDLVRTDPSPAQSVVVTDDIALADAIRRTGARTVRTAWLAGVLARQRLAAPSAGRSKPPLVVGGAAGAGADADGRGDGRDADAPRWQPGRGATRKAGNPKRGHPPR